MGCWNGTCNISNMPIFEGDKVVLIPLMKVHEGAVFNTCYPTDNFIPLGFPIVGEYNDYGGLQNIDVSEVNRNYFKMLNFYFYNRDKDSDERYVRVPDYEDFEDFINNVLCTVEGCFVEVYNKAQHKDGKAEINFMMVHYDLYKSLVSNMLNRQVYGESMSFGLSVRQDFCSIFSKGLEEYCTIQDMVNGKNDRVEEYVIDSLKRNCISNMSAMVFNKGDTFYEKRWDYFVNKLISDRGLFNELIDCAVYKYIFMIVLSRMRKGYLCDSGCGSQSEETKLHLIMADFIRKQVVKNAERYEDMTRVNGVEESIYI